MAGNDKTLLKIPRNSLYPLPLKPATVVMYHISVNPQKNMFHFYERAKSNKAIKYKTAREIIAYIKDNSSYRNKLHTFYAGFEEYDIEKQAELYAYPGKDESIQITNKTLYKNQLYIFYGHSIQYINTSEKIEEQKSVELIEQQPENDSDGDINIHNIAKGYTTPHTINSSARMTTRSTTLNQIKSNKILSNYQLVSTGGIYMKNLKNSIHIQLDRRHFTNIENVLVQYENGQTDVFINTKDITKNISTIKEDIRHLKGTQQQAIKQAAQVNKNFKKLRSKVGDIYKGVKGFKTKKSFKSISKQWQNVLTNDVLDVMGKKVGFGKEAVQKIVQKLLKLNPEAAPQLIELTPIERSHKNHQKQLQKFKENHPAHVYKNNYFIATGHISNLQNNKEKVNRENDRTFIFDKKQNKVRGKLTKNEETTRLMKMNQDKWRVGLLYAESLDDYRPKSKIWAAQDTEGNVTFSKLYLDAEHSEHILYRLFTYAGTIGILRGDVPHVEQLRRWWNEDICDSKEDCKYFLPEKFVPDPNMFHIDEDGNVHFEFEVWEKEFWDGKGKIKYLSNKQLVHVQKNYPGLLEAGATNSKFFNFTNAIINENDGTAGFLRFLKWKSKTKAKAASIILLTNTKLNRKLIYDIKMRHLTVLDLSALFSCAKAIKYRNIWTAINEKDVGNIETDIFIEILWGGDKWEFQRDSNEPLFGSLYHVPYSYLITMKQDLRPDKVVTNVPAMLRQWINQRVYLYRFKLIQSGKYDDIAAVEKAVRKFCEDRLLPFTGVGLSQSMDALFDSTHAKNSTLKHFVMTELYEIRKFGIQEKGFRDQYKYVLRYVYNRNNALKSTCKDIIKRCSATSRQKKIRTQWIGKIRKKWQETVVIYMHRISLIYTLTVHLLSLAVGYIQMFINDCFAKITEEFYYHPKHKIVVLALIRFIQIHATVCRRLFPAKYYRIHYIKFMWYAFLLVLLDFAIRSGMMPAAICAQAGESQGYFLGEHTKFTNNVKVQLPSPVNNENEDYLYDENEIDFDEGDYFDSGAESSSGMGSAYSVDDHKSILADESSSDDDDDDDEDINDDNDDTDDSTTSDDSDQLNLKEVQFSNKPNCYDGIWTRKQHEEMGAFDHGFVNSYRNVEKQRQKLKTRLQSLDKSVSDSEWTYLKDKLPWLLDLGYFKEEIDKFFNWKNVEKECRFTLNAEFVKIVGMLLEYKKPNDIIHKDIDKLSKEANRLLNQETYKEVREKSSKVRSKSTPPGVLGNKKKKK
eukprot:389051_1